MACYFCRAWNRESDFRTPMPETKGACTLSPTWAKTSGLHYCDQFRPDMPGMVSMWWERLDRQGKYNKEQTEKRKTAERKLKELRAKVRGKYQ